MEEEIETQSAPSKRHIVTTRSIILGLVLIPINCYWLAVMEIRWNSLDSTCVSLFFHVIFILTLLAAINALVRMRFPSIALEPAELLIIYIMLSITSAIMGRDSLENLLPVLGHLFWFADSTNKFSRFFADVPSWIAPRDMQALKEYYMGGSTLYKWQNIHAWLAPLAFWIVFVLVLTFIMLCMNVIVRKQWTERERLTFPIIQLPLAISGAQKGFFRSKIMWIGFAIPVIIQTINNISYFYPNLPTINLKLRNIDFTYLAPPWNGLGWVPIGFFPFAIGIAFFLPLDLSFSCWFFYILRRLIDVACVAWGFRDPGAPPNMMRIPFVREQGTGAWVGLSAALVWSSRNYLKTVIHDAFRTKGGGYDPESGMTYRTAILGIIVGMVLLVGMCTASGMSVWLPIVYFMFYFILSIGITRVRAELGPPAHELNWVNPENLMVAIFGTNMLGQRNLTLLTYMFWFNRGYRSHPMPHQLEALKIGQDTKMEGRRLLIAILLATVVGTIASLWALLDIFYRHGQATGHIMSYTTGIGNEAFARLQNWADNPQPGDWLALTFTGAGAVITLGLAALKSQFFWWPFHPIGYALANSYALEYFWTTIFIGWFIKFLMVRYGGVKMYRAAIPFFLGLVFGDYIIAALWSLIGSVLGVSTYRTFIF